MSYFGYERELISLFDNLKMQLLSRPLYLGGVSGSGGGTGGGVGGIVGQLPQSKVAYDTDEFGSLDTPISGQSLLDNLNHIRYRVSVLEGGGGSGITGQIEVQENGVTVSSAITVLNFLNAEVTETSDGVVSILTSGGGSGETIIVYSGSGGGEIRYTEDLTSQIPTEHYVVSQTIINSGLNVYWNGLRQPPSEQTVDVDGAGFTLVYSPISGDSLLVDYVIASSSVTTSGEGSTVLSDHDHSGDSGDGGTFDASNLTSGSALSGYVLTADGLGNTSWAATSGIATSTNYSQVVFTIASGLFTVSDPLKIYNCLSREVTISKVFLCVSIAPTGSDIIVDVNKNSTTIFTNQVNRPKITASNLTGSTTTIDVSSWADGDYLTVDIDSVGSIIAGSDLTIHVVYL